MDIQERLSMSYYKEIAVINEEHEISLVQNQHTHKIFIKKVLDVYNSEIYRYIKDHPIAHIPKIYDLFQCNDRLVIIEEYISGDTLESLLDHGNSFTNDEIRDIIIQLCDILSCLHKCDPPIIHRDIKPSNIVKTPSGEIFLLDLNAAKYQSTEKTEDTMLLGTKGYAAPEQYGFGTSNVQTDIYALGMLMNTLFFGEFSATIYNDPEFSGIIRKCIQLNPADRYKDVNSIKKILQNNRSSANPQKVPLNGWKSYLPPGFRTLNPLKMIIASVSYVFIFWLSTALQEEGVSPINLAIQRFFFLLIFLSIIFFTCNYRNIQQFFPFCKTRNIFLKILAVVLMDFIIFASLFVFMVLITSMFP